MKGNREVIEAGRKAWNQLSLIIDKEPEIFQDDNEKWEEFYELLCRKLFEDESRV